MRAIRAGVTVLIAAAVMLAIGCSSSGTSKDLAGAVYAKDVPVYKGATYVSSMGNESWGDETGSYTKGQTWWFKTQAAKDDLLTYYQKLYPNAEKLELDTGDIQLRWVPEGATRFEDITIVIGDGELRIGESVAPKGSPPASPVATESSDSES